MKQVMFGKISRIGTGELFAPIEAGEKFEIISKSGGERLFVAEPSESQADAVKRKDFKIHPRKYLYSLGIGQSVFIGGRKGTAVCKITRIEPRPRSKKGNTRKIIVTPFTLDCHQVEGGEYLSSAPSLEAAAEESGYKTIIKSRHWILVGDDEGKRFLISYCHY